MTSDEPGVTRSVSPGGDAWRGDVADGVAAWLGGAAASPPPSGQPPSPPPLASSDRHTDEPDADQDSVARRILLDQLAGQARSRHELAQRLRKKHVPEEVTARLLDRFEEVGLVDDAEYARAWVASRQARRGLAGRALAQELRRKGLDDELIKDAVSEIDPEDEEDAARDAVRRRLRTMRGLDETVATRRLVAMLARKGHGSDVALRVVREELAAWTSHRSPS